MKNSDIEVDMTYTQAFEKIKMLLKEKCMDKMFLEMEHIVLSD